MANMKMTNSIRNFVSKKRKRYVADGFNLDLSYITENLIAMGFPSEKLESIYRNPIDDVVALLESKHRDRYKIYNLCSERSYDTNKFQGRVAAYPFNDHNPPRIELVQKFCEDVHEWLSADPRNVAAVHCKAGKGRTGTMICCYLLYCGKFQTADESLTYYGKERTHDMKGVTIPSQRRYVEYYASLLSMSRIRCIPCLNLYSPPALLITELIMQPSPVLNGGQGTLEFYVFENKQTSQKVSLGIHEARKGSAYIRMRLDRCTPLVGDIKVEVYIQKTKIKLVKEKLFHFWFNTFFVKNEIHSVKEEASENGAIYRLTFDKWQLDDAHKDTQNKLYGSEFKVQLLVQFVPENSVWGSRANAVGASPLATPPSPPSPSSSGAEEDESDESLEPEEGWDSAVEGAVGGTGALLGHYRVLSETELDDIPSNPSNTITTQSQPEVERMLHA